LGYAEDKPFGETAAGEEPASHRPGGLKLPAEVQWGKNVEGVTESYREGGRVPVRNREAKEIGKDS
jgi:hypothetical protein